MQCFEYGSPITPKLSRFPSTLPYASKVLSDFDTVLRDDKLDLFCMDQKTKAGQTLLCFSNLSPVNKTSTKTLWNFFTSWQKTAAKATNILNVLGFSVARSKYETKKLATGIVIPFTHFWPSTSASKALSQLRLLIYRRRDSSWSDRWGSARHETGDLPGTSV